MQKTQLETAPLGNTRLEISRVGCEGLPEDDWRKHDARFHEPQLSRHLALADDDAAEIEGRS